MKRTTQEIDPDVLKKRHPIHKHLWASADGRVFSQFRGSARYGVPVSQVGGHMVNGKYHVVSVPEDDGEHTQVTLARIVWECFAGLAPKHFRIDHVNNDSTDTRLDNLRLATQAGVSQNGGMRKNNTSGYKGVSFDRRTGKYQAGIVVERKRTSLGGFPTAEEAAIAYDKAAIHLHGEFARTNAMLGLL